MDCTQGCSFTPTIGRTVLVQDVMRPPSRQKRMKRALESVTAYGVSERRLPSRKKVHHLDDTVFRRCFCKVQFSIRMTKFP